MLHQGIVLDQQRQRRPRPPSSHQQSKRSQQRHGKHPRTPCPGDIPRPPYPQRHPPAHQGQQHRQPQRQTCPRPRLWRCLPMHCFGSIQNVQHNLLAIAGTHPYYHRIATSFKIIRHPQPNLKTRVEPLLTPCSRHNIRTQAPTNPKPPQIHLPRPQEHPCLHCKVTTFLCGNPPSQYQNTGILFESC